MERAEKAVRRSHTQTPAQRASQYLAMPLEEHVAFLKQEDFTLEDLLKHLPIPNRPDALVPPPPPPYFQTIDRERRARMIEECARPGSELATKNSAKLDPAFHSAAAADLHSERSVHGENREGDRSTFPGRRLGR